MINTTMGPAEWQEFADWNYIFWVREGLGWTRVVELRPMAASGMIGTMVIKDPRTHIAMTQLLEPPLTVGAAKIRAMSMLVESGLIDPLDFLAACDK